MWSRLILAATICVGLAANAAAQQQAPGAHVVGTVVSRYGPTADAFVELLREAGAIRMSRTRADGRFEFVDVPSGDYRLRVRKLGLAAHVQQLRVPAIGDSVHVTLRDDTVVRDSVVRVEYERQLAAARARPRRWSCRVSARDVRRTAADTYEWISAGDSATFLEMTREYGMPPTRLAFLRDFRSVDDAQECRRLARAIDRQHGLVSDHLRVFRIGNVYFLPDFGDGGLIVGLDGMIRTIFIVPS